MIFRSIADHNEIDRLVSRSGKRATSARWVKSVLNRGESRPQWCRMAVSPDSVVLAAHAMDSWSPDGPPSETPTFVQLLGHTNRVAAVALLEHDLRAFNDGDIRAHLVFDVDSPPELGALREDQQLVLETVGFRLEVDRVRLEWLGSPSPREPTWLVFRAAATLAEEDLVEVFASVGDGSVDHGMVTDRAEVGRRAEARLRLDRARRRNYEDDWFVVGVKPDGVPVGYVQSAVSGDRAILAETGVVEAWRGHRHVDELLAYGTGVLARRGETRIRAFTDTENRAMRAAFARGGYVETGSRRDFRRTSAVG